MEEKTKEYIQLGKTWFWLFLSALILVFCAGTVWGLVGEIPVTDTVYGYAYDTNKVLCLMDASRYSGLVLLGNNAVVKTLDGTTAASSVTESTPFPLSEKELADEFLIPDWMMPELVNGTYMYALSVEVDPSCRLEEGVMVETSIVVDQKKPFELLF